MNAYFDNAATTAVCGEAADMAYRVMTECYGNPSSGHTMGRKAKEILESARGEIAKALGASAKEVIFTSGGTESDNWAVLCGAALNSRHGRHIISSAAEHEAVLRPLELLSGKGYEVTLLRPGGDGAVTAEAIRDALRPDTALVTLMLVNNETGGITDIGAISKLLRDCSSRALLHTDAVQGFLKLPFTVKSLGADMVSVSAHKIHGPKGAGALYIKSGVKLPPLISGGGQENGLRSGTEGLPQIAAFGAAVKAYAETLDESRERIRVLREHTVSRLQAEIPGVVFNGGGARHILSVSLPGYKSEVLINYLEARSVYAARSSACKKGGRSHVLEAIGLSDRVIDGALRISFSRLNTREETKCLCDTLISASKELYHK